MSVEQSITRFLLVMFAATGSACAAGANDTAAAGSPETSASLSTEDEATKSIIAPVPAEVSTAMADPDSMSDDALNRIFRLEHRISVGQGQKIAVTETFTIRSWLRWPHRAMMMIPAQGSNRSVYNVPVDGYDGGAIMARDGFFAFTVDPPGTGDSYQPENGLTVTYESEAATLSIVADRLRAMRFVPRMDLWGEELGGGTAIVMCGDAHRFRSCVASSMLYKTASDFFYQVAPFFEAFILGSPDGYFQSFPETYFNVLAGASPDVRDWYLSTQIGRYASGLYKQDFDRVLDGGNSYDPSGAAVPALLLRGENETNNPIEDTQHLAADYGSVGGGHAEVQIVPGGSHIFRLDAAPVGPSAWDITKAFVDGPTANHHD